MNIEQINNGIDLLKELKKDKIAEAKTLYPDMPKAQDVYVKLHSHSGGIEPVVETLRLRDEFEAYRAEIQSDFDRRASAEIINMKIEGFLDYCKDQFRENFCIFVTRSKECSRGGARLIVPPGK
jgi:hypothetical protein